jgi:nitrogen fixation/metabolism regulation signal transduction histidine kinase
MGLHQKRGKDIRGNRNLKLVVMYDAALIIPIVFVICFALTFIQITIENYINKKK